MKAMTRPHYPEKMTAVPTVQVAGWAQRPCSLLGKGKGHPRTSHEGPEWE
jgi:hypothetical protein